MKVYELLEQLAEMPLTAEVFLADWNEQYREPAELDAKDVVYHPEVNRVVLGSDN